MDDIWQRLPTIYTVVVTGIALVFFSVILNVRTAMVEKNLVIYGQEATIAAYKENLTECLQERKLTQQDEFTGE